MRYRFLETKLVKSSRHLDHANFHATIGSSLLDYRSTGTTGSINRLNESLNDMFDSTNRLNQPVKRTFKRPNCRSNDRIVDCVNLANHVHTSKHSVWDSFLVRGAEYVLYTVVDLKPSFILLSMQFIIYAIVLTRCWKHQTEHKIQYNTLAIRT